MAKRPEAAIDITARNRAQRAIDEALTQLKGLERSAKLLTGTLSGIAVLQIGRKFIDMADRAQTLENRLKLVTSSTVQLNTVQEDLFRLSQATYSSFEGTVELYARVASATAELGISQSRLINVTRTINEAMSVSGASAQEMESAMTQLSQGLAAGTLRGQDLNSVIAMTPRLAQAIADGMGIAFGQLKSFAEQGKITSEVVISALENQAETVRAEFELMAPTVGQGLTQLGNSLLHFVGRLDESMGTSRLFARALSVIAGGIDEVNAAIDESNDPTQGARTLKELRARLRELQDFQARMAARPNWAIVKPEFVQSQIDAVQEAINGIVQAQGRGYAEFLRKSAEAARQAHEQRQKEEQERVAAEREALQKQLTDVVDASKSKEQVEAESHRRRLEILRNALQQGLIEEERFRQLSADLALRAAERGLGAQEGTGSGGAEQQAIREKLEQELEQFRQFTLTREQVELEAHARRMEVLRTAFEMELIEKQRFDELAIQLAQTTQERITAITREQEESRANMTRDMMLSQVQSTLQGFAMLTQASESGSKRLFKIHKALAIASAIVSTHKSVAEALATPPTPNIPLAAFAAAKGAIEIAGIKSQNFTGGGGGSFNGGGGGAATPAQPPLPRIPDRSEARGAVHVEVSLAGATIVGPGGAEQFAETVVEIIRDRVENRDEVIITPSSRQAAELRT